MNLRGFGGLYISQPVQRDATVASVGTPVSVKGGSRMRYGIMRVFVLLSLLVPLSVSAPAAKPKIDFNGDGRADVFLRNLFTGDIAAWLINDGGVPQSVLYGTVAPSTGWTPINVGDFNGDGRTDLLWYNGFT